MLFKNNTKLKVLILGIAFLMFNACEKDDTVTPNNNGNNATAPTKILPLGASRVDGARPLYESYRYELWKDLKENNWNFDFIGTRTDTATYPTFNDLAFDTDHEGRGGWTSGQILSGLEGWLDETEPADIVLFSTPGGNDILQGLSYSQAKANINAIIDIFQEDNPNVTIIIEQMAPAHSLSTTLTPQMTVFLEQMQQDVLNIATNQTTETSQVIAVDMFTGFNDSFLADLVHYNEAGAKFIASRYYDVLTTVLE